jgi:hypothetical protein
MSAVKSGYGANYFCALHHKREVYSLTFKFKNSPVGHTVTQMPNPGFRAPDTDLVTPNLDLSVAHARKVAFGA